MMPEKPTYEALEERVRQLEAIEAEQAANISALRLSEEEHQQTEQQALRFNRIVEDSLNEIYIFDADTLHFIKANRGARQNLGYSMDELRQLTPVDIKPELSAENFEQLIEPLRTGVKESVRFNTIHRRKDGTRYPVEVHLQLYQDDTPLFVAIILDISERQRIEQALIESEERLDLALEGANEGIWDWRIDQDSIYFDERYYTMAGYQPNEFSRKFSEWEKRVHTDDLKEVKATIERYMSGELDTFNVEFRFRRKDGSYMWILGKGKIVDRDDQGRATRFIGTHADISMRKEMENSLNKTLKSLENSQKLAKVGSFEWDIENGEVEWSDEVYRIFGRDPETFNPNIDTVMTQFHPEDRNLNELIFEKAQSSPDQFSFDSRIIMPDGNTRFLVSTAEGQYNGDGNLQKISGTVQDITERRQAEEALERRIVALTQPLKEGENIAFDDLFNISDIQQLQDLYAEAFGVAALITQPDGTPITQPSNFTTLCGDIIRKTDKGLQNCQYSDSLVGRPNTSGPNIQPCLSAGLCNAGASITIGGRHIANWLIGQVRNEKQKEEEIMVYAREIGADEPAFRNAYRQVPTMSEEQFERVAKVLYTVANQLSVSAYQNVQQARFIAQRKQDEEELRQLRNYLSNIIDSMPSVLVAVDREGRVTQWNHQTEKNTGLGFNEVRARPLGQVLPQLASEMDRIQRAIKARQVISTPKVSRRLAEGTHYEDITIFPLVANGVEGAVIRVDDVTEQVQLEEMMIQSEKMLTVGGLAAGMAHEINNPLAGMMQTAGVIANRLSSGFRIPASQKAAEQAGTTLDAVENFMKARGIPRMLDAIVTSGQRVSEIVSNMLSFARKSDEKVLSYHLNNLLDETLELAATDYDLKKHYDFKKIKIIKKYSDSLPAVPCQSTKIQQVLLNVLSNGAQAMQTAGTADPQLTLKTYSDPNNPMVCIEIEDNGPGMDESTRKKVFDPFFTTKNKGMGTGLGLSISYFIITENHNGEMTVESEPGRGAKFIIRLPTLLKE